MCKITAKIYIKIMEFIITGATGFLGKEVTNKALDEGHRVFAATRDVGNAKDILGARSGLEFLKIEDIGKINCSRVIHLAWADVQNYTDDKNFAKNVEFQLNLLEDLAASGVTDFTVAGTCLEYGMTEGICSENAIPGNITKSYARAKRLAHLKLLELQKQSPGMIIKWARCFYAYGRNQRAKSLLTQLMQAIESGQQEFNMSQGDQMRDFINVDTLTHNLLKLAGQDKVTGIVNIGSGKPTTVLSFIEQVLEIKDYKLKLNRGYYPYAADEPRAFWADISKLKAIEGTKFDDKIWL